MATSLICQSRRSSPTPPVPDLVPAQASTWNVSREILTKLQFSKAIGVLTRSRRVGVRSGFLSYRAENAFIRKIR